MIIKDKKTPGQKLIKKMPIRTKWILTALSSFIIIGFGMTFLLESFYRLHSGFDVPTWSFLGLLSFVVVFSGLMLFSKSVTYHSEIRSRKIWKQKQKELKKRRFENKGTDKLSIQKSPQR